MTVTHKGVIPGSHSGSNERGIYKYSWSHRVTTDDPMNDGPLAIGEATGLPHLGDAWPEDSGAWCYSASVEADEPPLGWRVTFNYTSEWETNNTPTLAAPRISWSSTNVEVPIWITVEATPKAIVNSAGDFFDQVPTRSESRFTANIIANLGTYGTLLALSDYINANAITIDGVSIPARCGKLGGISVSDAKNINGITYHECSYSVEVNPHTWLHQPLDCGFRALTSSGDMRVIRSDDLTPVANPALLNGSGVVVEEPGPDTAVFGNYKIYNEGALSVLPGIV